MFSKTARALVSCLATCLVIVSLAKPVQAGGFGLLVEVPVASFNAAQPDDTVFIVQAVGCHGPGAAVSAKAEGLVDGKRISTPIRLDHLGNDVYRVKRQWPVQGTWAVSLSAKSAHAFSNGKQSVRPVTSIVVEFAPDGSVKNTKTITDPRDGRIKKVVVRARHINSKDKAREIDGVLHASAVRSRNGRAGGA